MGGHRIKSTGIDEEGNAANFVETEQVVIKTVQKDNYKRLFISSYV